MQRHFCTSVYTYRPDTRQFLLIKHKKLGKWLQPGGHVDPDELPDTAAVREVFEETGLHVELIGDHLPRPTDPVRPFAMQLNVITENEHEHIDFVYLATPVGSLALTQNVQETDGIKWYALDEILNDDFDTFDTVKHWCRYFFNHLNFNS